MSGESTLDLGTMTIVRRLCDAGAWATPPLCPTILFGRIAGVRKKGEPRGSQDPAATMDRSGNERPLGRGVEQVRGRDHRNTGCVEARSETPLNLAAREPHQFLAGARIAEPRRQEPDDAEVSRRNWEEPTDASADAWSTARTRLSDTHRQIAEALENEHEPLDRLKYLLPHDCYHFGQIMYVRALQGLPSID